VVIVPEGTYFYARTLDATSTISELQATFQVYSGKGVLYISTVNPTPSSDSAEYSIGFEGANTAIVTNDQQEVYFGAFALTTMNCSIVYQSLDGGSNPGNSSNGISLLFYLIIFFMCFFGILFVGTFILKLRQYYNFREAQRRLAPIPLTVISPVRSIDVLLAGSSQIGTLPLDSKFHPLKLVSFLASRSCLRSRLISLLFSSS